MKPLLPGHYRVVCAIFSSKRIDVFLHLSQVIRNLGHRGFAVFLQGAQILSHLDHIANLIAIRFCTLVGFENGARGLKAAI